MHLLSMRPCAFTCSRVHMCIATTRSLADALHSPYTTAPTNSPPTDIVDFLLTNSTLFKPSFYQLKPVFRVLDPSDHDSNLDFFKNNFDLKAVVTILVHVLFWFIPGSFFCSFLVHFLVYSWFTKHYHRTSLSSPNTIHSLTGPQIIIIAISTTIAVTHSKFLSLHLLHQRNPQIIIHDFTFKLKLVYQLQS